MRNLILFFIRYSPLFLFVIYIITGIFMLVDNNPYQRHVYLTSANSVSSSFYRVSNNVTSYFHLRNINEELAQRNTELELTVLDLQQKLKNVSGVDSSYIFEYLSPSRYSMIRANVINNSTKNRRNYITLDKGSLDGIEPEMGVMDHNGIIGIVELVAPHSSRVISFLNDQFRLSCKVKGYDIVGSLVWNGENAKEAILEELPRHSSFNVGDTIVTSGYSTVFPEGIPVGIVTQGLKDYDESFYALKVKLFTNFETISSVKVVKDNLKEELISLESGKGDGQKVNKKGK